jgi:CheY-like chemotaxis protein/anti-sigma regulatory factor (Ser/Thr protein kinase)
MSHELRTPLDVIIGTAQLLSRPSHRARLREGLADISANGRQLLKMIDEVLDYSRGLIGRLSLAPEPVSWPDFLRGVQHNAEILAARNGNAATLTVDGERLEAVCLDERRLRQVLDNLIANAARHTRNGRIALACTIGPAQPDSRRMLAFSVTDTGEGIRPEDIERIFQPFERGSNSVRHGGKGAGMGLAISRQIIELMGGKLTAESTPGEGACFRFGMFVDPADMADAKAPALERLGGYAGAPRTILIADDEPGNRAILAAMLRDSGFIVIEAESGRAAAAEAARAPVDAVLTDQFMADGDGWHVLREIAQQRRGVPVVLISAAPPERPDGFPAEIAFAGHLLKPLDHSDVLRCLGNLLGLDWIETEAANPAPETPLQRPGNAALRDLRELVDAGRISDIVVWAENLKARNEACAPFADQVRDAARDLDFAALANLATRETAAGAET